MRVFTLLLLVLIACAATALAQNCPPVEAYAQYSHLSVDSGNITSRQGTNGYEAGFALLMTHRLAVEFEYSHYHGDYLTVPANSGVSEDMYFVGPRVNFKWLFVHGIFGGDHFYDVAFNTSVAQQGFSGALGGGIYRKIKGPWSLRGSVDYVFSRHSIFNSPVFTQNNFRAGVGIAYTFRRNAVNY